MRMFTGFTAAVLATLVGSSCAPQTKMLSSWKAPGLREGTVKKVLVLGVARDAAIRRTYEDRFVADLRKHGYAADPAYPVAPDPETVDEKALTEKLKSDGYSHLLATRVVDKKTVETYVPPTVTTVGVGAPYGYYGGWGGYWSMGYATSVSPGYTRTDEVYRLETKMWDLASGDMIWTGLSETWVGGAPEANIDAVISKVVYNLRANGVL